MTNPTTAKLVINGTAGSLGLDMSSTDQYADMRVIRNTLSTIDRNLYIGYSSGVNSIVFFYSNSFTETMRCQGGNVVISNNLNAGSMNTASFYCSGTGYFADTLTANNLAVFNNATKMKQDV
jgi:hypothetical protein